VTPTFEAETGAIYSPPGGGASCAGTGIHAAVRADYEWWWAKQLAKAVVSELEQILGHIERTRGSEFVGLEFHVESLDGLRASSVMEPNLKVRLNLPMKFDHNLDPARFVAPLVAAAISIR